MSGQRAGNPLESRMGRGALANGVEAHIRRVFVSDGAPWIEAEHPQTGQRWKAPVLFASNGPGSIDYAPLQGSSDPAKLGPRVRLLFVDSYRAPVLLGCDAYVKLVASAPTPEPGKDRAIEPAITDRVILNGGGGFIIDDRGDVTLTTQDAAGDGTVRIQLKDGAALRISRGGKADERLVLAGPLLDYLTKLEAKVAALATALELLAAGSTTAYKALPAAVAADAKLKAAAIAISADAEA